MNFEAQGASGAPLMYGQRPQRPADPRNAQSGALSVASSLMAEVARRFTSSDSDLSVFRRAGMSGLNLPSLETNRGTTR